MDFNDNNTNRRMIAGYLPSEKLYIENEIDLKQKNFKRLAQSGLEELRENPEIMQVLFALNRFSLNEIEQLKRPEVYHQEVNILINTGYDRHSVNIMGGAFLPNVELCIAVTRADRILWYGIYNLYMSNQLGLDVQHFDKTQNMMYAWIYLLHELQDKEIKHGKTIKTRTIPFDTDIFGLIEGDWNSMDKEYFSTLSDQAIHKIKENLEECAKLQGIIENENNKQQLIADETAESWVTFVDVINDLSEKEGHAILSINSATSSKEKIRAIREYDSVLFGMNKGEYVLCGRKIELLPLYGNVIKRIKEAPLCCVLKTNSGTPFIVNPAIIILAMNPQTYNYLFMIFHSFRLDPRKDNARKFVSAALSYIKRNLGEQASNWVSIMDMIDDFYSTVMNFSRDNDEAISRLSFKTIQGDTAVLDKSFIPSIMSDYEKNDLLERIKGICEEDIDARIEELLDGKVDQSRLLTQLRYEDEHRKINEQNALARQIIVSLNIIYMFCDALRIMLSNKHSNVKINKDVVMEYRRELRKLDDQLVHKVYII